MYTDFPLKKLNTFGFDIRAKQYFEFTQTKEVLTLLKNKQYLLLPRLILGAGSNILFTKDFDGIVIHPNIKGIKITEDFRDHILLKVYCGESWDNLVEYAIENNLGGIENLSFIPGTVGASVVQNIGAYGVEVKDSVEIVEAINIETSELVFFSNHECKFGYRDSIFKNEYKNKFIVISVSFKLSKHPVFNTSYGNIEDKLKKSGKINLSAIRQAVINIRRQKLPDPAEIGNAGSFFKNPVINKSQADFLKTQYANIQLYPVSDLETKVAAGWLIEHCGWKGRRTGNVGVHDKQALVLVNYGSGNGSEILELSKKIQESVFEKFKINLIPEVNIF
ncbi:MAG: UDP-N-acetylmuramate dehydrogenase [Bacteroidia bacterium]|nr:UDP-N-acetylmuramate dehydrogenase [Bacteroidia bacterium]